MCGILGYIGQNDVIEIILTGLKRLEYRGYDSAGVAVIDDNTVKVFKSQGITDNLRNTDLMNAQSTIGIGHTRWATQGCVNLINAHPHQSTSGRFTIVHNGIIQNEYALKKKYLANYPFISETDSEVIVGLIELLTEKYHHVEAIIQKLLTMLKGSYTFALIDSLQPDVIYAVKNKAPLLIGVGENFHMLGSDAISMSHKTNEFYITDNKEYVKLTKDKATFFNNEGLIIEKESTKFDFTPQDITKGGYDSHLFKEILEQPQVLRNLSETYLLNEWPTSSKKALSYFKSCKRIFLVAGGTGLQTCSIAKKYFEQLAEIPVEVHLSSELAHHLPFIPKDSLFVIVSTSGESADGRNALLRLKKMGHPVVCLTNALGSALARESDAHIYLDAGCELAVTSTKTYLAQLAIFAIFANELAKNCKLDLLELLKQTSNAIEDVLENLEEIKKLAKTYFTTDDIFYLGRHLDGFTAKEGALKFKELAYVKATGIAGGELKYGDLALVTQETVAIGLITDEVVSTTMRGNVALTRARGATCFTISTASLSFEGDHIVVKDVHPLFRPLVTIVPLQLLAYFTGVSRNLNVDRPRHLAKL